MGMGHRSPTHRLRSSNSISAVQSGCSWSSASMSASQNEANFSRRSRRARDFRLLRALMFHLLPTTLGRSRGADAPVAFRHESSNRAAQRDRSSTGTCARFESLPFRTPDRPTRGERRRSTHHTHCTERTSHLPFSARLPVAKADACRQRCEALLQRVRSESTGRKHPPSGTHERLRLALPRRETAAGGNPPPPISLITSFRPVNTPFLISIRRKNVRRAS